MKASPRTRTPAVALRPLSTAASVGCALLLILIAHAGPASAQSPGRGQRLLDGAERILFLGDSNTDAGGFVYRLEAALRLGGRIGDDVEVINLGLSSETCSGLSEAAHPFPRPDVHERLGRALEKADPDVVFACYGMNDGIYSQFRTDRFEAFQNGIRELAEKVKASGAKLVLVTPPPFDPEPLRTQGKLRPSGYDRYDWTHVYEDYDRDVIAKYAEWLRGQRGLADLTIDLHRRLARQLAQLRRSDPAATLTTDGVHFNAAGHNAAAEILHGALGFGPLPEPDEDLLEQISRRHEIMHPAWLSHVGHERPGVKPGLPLDEARAEAEAGAGG